jgi:O-succinylbenzoate synthase
VIWYWPYALKPKRALNALAGDAPRRGALIRVGSGYADVHPWPELGDATIDEQLAMLARGRTTSLTDGSMYFARIDAEARERGFSLFEGLTIPESHWPGADPPDAFETVKLKNVDRIPDRVRLRIDFNATLTAEEFVRVAATLPRERVDFVEDPCPYDAEVWRDLRERTGLRLALDRADSQAGGRLRKRSIEAQSGPYDVVVVKPALEDVPVTTKEIVITSYMDHPVGQLFAAYVAATHYASRQPPAAGLVTHVLFESDPFIERMQLDGARLVPPPGTGIGFDDLLESLPWKKLG